MCLFCCCCILNCMTSIGVLCTIWFFFIQNIYLFFQLWYDVFWEYYINFNMGAMRRYWASLMDNFQGQHQNRLDFVSRDRRIIEPVVRATEFVIQIEYRCRNNHCRYHRYPYLQRFSTLHLVQRYEWNQLWYIYKHTSPKSKLYLVIISLPAFSV